jgi:hypothetical protein
VAIRGTKPLGVIPHPHPHARPCPPVGIHALALHRRWPEAAAVPNDLLAVRCWHAS